MKKIEVMLILFALLTGLVFLHASAEEGTHIVILGTSDMHGNIYGDMFKDRITSVQTTTACMEPPLRPA